MKVLICEDDVLLQRTLKVVIERNGDEVIQAFEGGESKAMIETASFDVIIMDVHLPYISGLELIDHIRRVLNTDVPVVVLSAISDAQIKERALQLGASYYMVKPVDPKELLKLLHSSLHQS